MLESTPFPTSMAETVRARGLRHHHQCRAGEHDDEQRDTRDRDCRAPHPVSASRICVTSRSRARATRERIVPTGTPQIAAVSS